MTVQSTWYKKSYILMKKKTICEAKWGKSWVMYKNINRFKESIENSYQAAGGSSMVKNAARRISCEVCNTHADYPYFNTQIWWRMCMVNCPICYSKWKFMDRNILARWIDLETVYHTLTISYHVINAKIWYRTTSAWKGQASIDDTFPHHWYIYI